MGWVALACGAVFAADLVAKAPADGDTFLLSTNTINSGNSHLFKKMP